MALVLPGFDGAGLLQRRCSHSAATTSGGSDRRGPDARFQGARTHASAGPRHAGTTRAVARDAGDESSPPTPFTEATLRPTRQSRDVTAAALETADYSFYQDMTNDEISADFLWTRLEPKLQHLSASDKGAVHTALNLAYNAHNGQVRKSGEPFITHPLEVTRILAELVSERDTLVAGLLHDTVEDTDTVTLSMIEESFGYECMRIVEGETKFSKLTQLQQTKSSSSKEDLQALDLQQLFLAMTEDARIIIVKLADRLHNMRTMASMPPHKQHKIARETLSVFAPLASLLGLHSIKTELEDLSMQYAMPEVYALIAHHRQELMAVQEAGLKEAQRTLDAQLRADPYFMSCCTSLRVQHEYRSLYSTYKSARVLLQNKLPHVPLSDVPVKRMHELFKAHGILNAVTDIAQLSVVIGEPAPPPAAELSTGAEPGAIVSSGVQLCYQALGILHSMWAPVPGTIKDFISTPKRNGYQGLHTSLLPLGCSSLMRVEVLVRTGSMQRLADFGIAADTWTLRAVGHSGDSGRSSAAGPSSNGAAAGAAASGAPRAANGATNGVAARAPRSDAAVSNGASVTQHGAASGSARANGASANGTAAGSSNGVHSHRLHDAAGASGASAPANGHARPQSSNGAVPSNGASPTNGASTSNGSSAMKDPQSHALDWGPAAPSRGDRNGSSNGNGSSAANGAHANGAHAPAGDSSQHGPSSNGRAPGPASHPIGAGRSAHRPTDGGADGKEAVRAAAAVATAAYTDAQHDREDREDRATGAHPAASESPNGSSSTYAPTSNGSTPNGSRGLAAVQHLTPAAPQKLGKDALERRVNWLNSIREWQAEFLGSLSAQEFVQCIRDDLLSQTVFVFTPSGDLMRLPKGATVVDFAYHVHSEVGNSMVAARVNGRDVQPWYTLRNADVVEVVHALRTRGNLLRGEQSVVHHKEWLGFAKTRSARHKLKMFIKEHSAPVEAVADSVDVYDGDSALGGVRDVTGLQAAPVPKRRTTWLFVECTDRAGILAEVAAIIADNSHNITAYSGSTPAHPKNGDSLSFMNFDILGDSTQLPAMCERIATIEGIIDWSIGSGESSTYDGST